MDRIYFGIRTSLGMWGAVKSSCNSLKFERSLEVAARLAPFKKKPQDSNPAAFLLFVRSSVQPQSNRTTWSIAREYPDVSGYVGERL